MSWLKSRYTAAYFAARARLGVLGNDREFWNVWKAEYPFDQWWPRRYKVA